MNRPGTMLVGFDESAQLPVAPADDSNSFFRPVLIPFIFSETQGFVLVFGSGKIRFIFNGSFILENGIAISGISLGSTTTVTTAVPHGYSNGDIVWLNVAGTEELRGRFFKVANVGASTFRLDTMHWTSGQINSTGFGTFTSGSVARVYSVSMSYTNADLQQIKFVQSADVMVLVHPSYPPAILTRVTNTNWTLANITFGATIAAPATVTVTSNLDTGSTEYSYTVTAVSNTDASEGRGTGDSIEDLEYWTGNKSNHITWDAVTGANFYNIYRAPVTADRVTPSNALYGLIGSARGTTFNDQNLAADFGSTPPDAKNPFSSSNNYPSSVAFFQQRLGFAGTNNQPTTLFFSKVGTYYNLDESLPSRDTDSITAAISALRVDPISNLLAMPGGLLVFTSGAVYQVTAGGENQAITPTNISSSPQSYFGASNITPIAIGVNVLYTQAKGSVLRSLVFNLLAQTYETKDVSLLASHMFKNFTIEALTYAAQPWKTVWATRSDGQLLTMTYEPEQNVIAWSRQNTQGIFQSICTIPEGTEDGIYIVVWRELADIDGGLVPGGYYVPCIERFSSRDIQSARIDAWFVDCGLASTLTYPNAVLYPSAASGDNVTFLTNNAVFTADMIGYVLIAGGGVGEVVGFDSTTSITVNIIEDLTDLYEDGTPRQIGPDEWSLTAKSATVAGLSHLEGLEVTGLADGEVISPRTVAGGEITLDNSAANVIVGLPYTSQLVTPYLELQPTIQGKRKSIPGATVRMYRSRGMESGFDLDHLIPIKFPGSDDLAVFTGDIRHPIGSNWDTPGQVAVQQALPLPMTILGIIPEVTLGDS